MFDYEVNPQEIEKRSFQQIRQLTRLNHFTRKQSQVVMRVVHSLGMPEVAEQIRFSSNACEAGCNALLKNNAILCDVEMVKQGVTKRLIKREPLCFLNDAKVKDIAMNTGETRSMAALSLWRSTLKDSVIIIGNAPTALFRLIEMLNQGCDKPALIIGMPVGFIGAAESKQTLWDLHQRLGVECITLLGRQGGSAASAACCNALLRCNQGEWY